MSVKLSAVILTKNEEDKISRCIASVKWADEVLVIDDESTDKTREIAENLGARVVVRPLNGDFAGQRNFGFQQAQGDWVLQMDADEMAAGKLKNEIEKSLTDNCPYSAFIIKRKEFFLGHFMQYGGWYIDELKLFRRGACKYAHSVHERPQVIGSIGRIDADIEHYPFNSIFQYIERQNRYTSLEAEALFKEKGIVKIKEIKYNLWIKPLKLFFKLYFKKKGYKDGFYGLVYAILNSFRHFLRWAKYWEIVNNNHASPPPRRPSATSEVSKEFC
ncbi:MAG: glycosyltransferase family 2 protein [Candidatus Omnitrophota bacterium]